MSDQLFEFVKAGDGLVPGDRRAKIKVGRLGDGELVFVTLRKPRNPQFHRKFMKMVRVAFEQWEPQAQEIDGVAVQKSFKVFYRELVIQAGFYEPPAYGIDGSVKLEARSLRFDQMDDDEFTEVYEAVLQVILGGVLQGVSREEAERMADAVQDEGFAS